LASILTSTSKHAVDKTFAMETKHTCSLLCTQERHANIPNINLLELRQNSLDIKVKWKILF